MKTSAKKTSAKKKSRSWRDSHIKVHPAADLFPMMSESDAKALAMDIFENGLQQKPVKWKDEAGREWLLDGRNRLDAMESLGMKLWSGGHLAVAWREVPSKVDPYAWVISANAHRRHLTTAQKRELIDAVIKARPEKSDRAIAKIVKVSDKTVAAARRKSELTAEIPQSKTRVGVDGKTRKLPVPKPAAKVKPAAMTESEKLEYSYRHNGHGPDGLKGPLSVGVQARIDALKAKETAAAASPALAVAATLAERLDESAAIINADVAGAAENANAALARLTALALHTAADVEAWGAGRVWESATVTDEAIAAVEAACSAWDILRTHLQNAQAKGAAA